MTINPGLLSVAERLQYEGYLRREDANAGIMAIAKEGIAIKEIMRWTRHSRGLVRRILRGERGDVFRVRESSLEGHLHRLENERTAGSRNGAELWRRLKPQGFRGSLRVVTEWATRRRQAECVDAESLHCIPVSANHCQAGDNGSRHSVESQDGDRRRRGSRRPSLTDGRTLIKRFHTMIRRRSEAAFVPWIEEGRASLAASFATGVARDIDTGRADHERIGEWADRRPDCQVQARQTADVRTRQNRPPAARLIGAVKLH